MDILIHVPSEDIPTKQDMIDVSLHFIDGHVSSCTYPFTELKKGHGKVVDLGKIDEDRIEKDNPVIYLTVNGDYTEAISLDYLNNLDAIAEADTE